MRVQINNYHFNSTTKSEADRISVCNIISTLVAILSIVLPLVFPTPIDIESSTSVICSYPHIEYVVQDGMKAKN